MRLKTYLDKPICRITIPDICNCEGLALHCLPDTHCEEGNGTLPCAGIADIKMAGVRLDSYGEDGGRKKIEEVTERDARSEAVP